jgi:hypothetical protein
MVVEDRSYRLRGSAPAVAAVRLAVDDLRWELRPTVLNKVRVLASELVTSAIAQAGHHTDDWVDIEVSVTPWQVRVEVSCETSPEAAHGRFEYPPTWSGAMLDDLADDWGFVRDEDGRMIKIWFEIDPSKATPLVEPPVRAYIDV